MKQAKVSLSLPQYLYDDYLRYKHRMNLSAILQKALEEEVRMLEMIDNRHFSNRKLESNDYWRNKGNW